MTCSKCGREFQAKPGERYANFVRWCSSECFEASFPEPNLDTSREIMLDVNGKRGYNTKKGANHV